MARGGLGGSRGAAPATRHPRGCVRFGRGWSAHSLGGSAWRPTFAGWRAGVTKYGIKGEVDPTAKQRERRGARCAAFGVEGVRRVWHVRRVRREA